MRRQDWVGRLSATVAEWAEAPFCYGAHDCCLFAARCIDAMTGSERAAELSTQYRDRRSALRFIASSGGIEGAISERLGSPVDGNAAGCGDVCLVPVEDGDGVGVCLGSSIAVAAESGLAMYPRSLSKKFWRIG